MLTEILNDLYIFDGFLNYIPSANKLIDAMLVKFFRIRYLANSDSISSLEVNLKPSKLFSNPLNNCDNLK